MSLKRILVAHNHYQLPGGEDEVFAAEVAMLRSKGHFVVEYTEDSRDLDQMNMMVAAGRSIWSRPSRNSIREVLVKNQLEIAHFHNTFPLLSPSVYWACSDAGVPVVQTLHNYRLLCPAATFLRDGRICQDCLGKAVPWPGVLHGCYRDSRTQSAVVATMLGTHRLLSTWISKVTVYIALTEFAREAFIDGGLPADRIMVKPNFIAPDPGVRDADINTDNENDYAIFVGRLSPEKGVKSLLRAWSQLRVERLKIVGDGPLHDETVKVVAAEDLKRVEVLGWRPRAEVIGLIKRARCLVSLQEWRDTFGLVEMEALACGVPIVSWDVGETARIVRTDRAGLVCHAGDHDDLVRNIRWAMAHPREMAEFGRNGRQAYERSYTLEANYKRLMEIYGTAAADKS